MATPGSTHLSSVAPDIRTQRDNYIDSLIGARSALTPQTAARYGPLQGSALAGSALAGSPEIPAVANRKIVLATFGAHIPILTASERAIYSEATISLVDILDNNVSPVAQIGDTPTLILPGGSIVKDDGSLLSFFTQPRKHYVGPGRFLLVLYYHQNGDFYMMARAWDVSTGTAHLTFGYPLQFQSIPGLTVLQLSSMLRSQFGS